MISSGESRTALYRFYDACENVLYIGITNDPWRRWRDHVQAKPWYPQVKHQAVTWYETEAEARWAETVAIRTEHPQFNIAGAIRPPEARVTAALGGATWFCTQCEEIRREKYAAVARQVLRVLPWPTR